MIEIAKIDSTYNEGMFISKVNNIFVMLHCAIMMNDIDRVRHFLSDELEKKYENLIEDLNKKNVIQMYDELNVKSTQINDYEIVDNTIRISVTIVSRYMDYLVDKNTKKIISGINNRRIEKNNYLVFEKKIGVSYTKIDYKCPGCGANIDINRYGMCEYCGTIFNIEDCDWVLVSITTN